MEHISELLRELGTWLDRVSVSGESVDYLAMARQTYRAVCHAAQRDNAKKEDTNG